MDAVEVVRVVLSILGTLVAVFSVLVPVGLYVHKSIMDVITSNSREAWNAIAEVNKSLSRINMKIAVIMTRMKIEKGEQDGEGAVFD